MLESAAIWTDAVIASWSPGTANGALQLSRVKPSHV
jgi:hypothetical protein